MTGLQISHGRGFGNNSWEEVNDQVIPWNDYAMRVNFKTTFHAARDNEGTGARLLATSCDPDGQKGSTIGVDTLYLISMRDYNDIFHKNDTINPIVEIGTDSYGYFSFLSLSEYVMYNREGIKNMQFDIKLNQPPGEDGTYQFKIVYALEDGQVFQADSDKLKLMK